MKVMVKNYLSSSQSFLKNIVNSALNFDVLE